MRKLGYVRADSTLGKPSYMCEIMATLSFLVYSMAHFGLQLNAHQCPKVFKPCKTALKKNAEFLKIAISKLNATPLRQRPRIKS
jgi:hypothetical protein